jgi:hypothetical protein
MDRVPLRAGRSGTGAPLQFGAEERSSRFFVEKIAKTSRTAKDAKIAKK